MTQIFVQCSHPQNGTVREDCTGWYIVAGSKARQVMVTSRTHYDALRQVIEKAVEDAGGPAVIFTNNQAITKNAVLLETLGERGIAMRWLPKDHFLALAFEAQKGLVAA